MLKREGFYLYNTLFVRCASSVIRFTRGILVCRICSHWGTRFKREDYSNSKREVEPEDNRPPVVLKQDVPIVSGQLEVIPRIALCLVHSRAHFVDKLKRLPRTITTRFII